MLSTAVRPRRRRRPAAAALALLVLTGCAAGAGGPGRFPPPPPTPAQDLGPDQPPVIWVGGVLTRVSGDGLELREPAGAIVRLRRLAAGATSFFRVAGERWKELTPGAPVRAGEPACVEVLMHGRLLLAIRVFLGAGCGPA